MKLVPLRDFNGMLPGLPNLRVLAVDDNPAELALMEDCFLQYRPTVRFITATTASLALAEVMMLRDDERPHVAMVDINMPLFTGFELAEQLTRQDVPTILMSNYLNPDRIARAHASGAIAVLEKPSNISEYSTLAQQVLKTARLV